MKSVNLLIVGLIFLCISCKKEEGESSQQLKPVPDKVFIRIKNISAFRLYDVQIDALYDQNKKSYGELYTNQVTEYVGYPKVYQPIGIETYKNPLQYFTYFYPNQKEELKPGKYTIEVFVNDQGDKNKVTLLND